MRESMATLAAEETEVGSLLPSCQGGKNSVNPNNKAKKKKRNKNGNYLGDDANSKEGINMLSSDSDDSATENRLNKGDQSSESEQEPDEFEVTNADGTITKMINTASGLIPLDFSNTKIIQDGKVFNINDLSAFSHEGNGNNDGTGENTSSVQPGMGDVVGANMIKQMASYNKDGCNVGSTNAHNYATDIGLFKAGMEQIDQNEVKKVIHESSANSEYFKT